MLRKKYKTKVGKARVEPQTIGISLAAF